MLSKVLPARPAPPVATPVGQGQPFANPACRGATHRPRAHLSARSVKRGRTVASMAPSPARRASLRRPQGASVLLTARHAFPAITGIRISQAKIVTPSCCLLARAAVHLAQKERTATTRRRDIMSSRPCPSAKATIAFPPPRRPSTNARVEIAEAVPSRWGRKLARPMPVDLYARCATRITS